MRIASYAVAVAIFLACAGARADESFVVELNFNRTVDHDFSDLRRDARGRLHVPVEAIFALGEGLVKHDGDRWRLDVLPMRRWLELDLAAGRLHSETQDRALSPDEWTLADGRLLVEQALLESHFGLSFHFDEYAQRLSVLSAQPWPADLRRARAQQWSRHGASDEDAAGPQPFDVHLPYQPWGVPQGDVSLGFDARSRQMSYSAQLALEALWLTQRANISGNSSGGISSLRWQAGRTAAEGGVFGVPALHDVQVGDVQTLRLPLIGSVQSGRGVRWQAAPLDRPAYFDSTVIEGDAPSNWDAELYAGMSLVDFARVGADGRYRFENIPLTFGANDLRVVLHGPNGQREERLTRQSIGAGVLRPGEWQSQGHLVQEGSSLWQKPATAHSRRREPGWSGAAMVDHGISPMLTVGGRWSRNGDGSGVLRDYVGLAARPVWGSNDFSLDLIRQLAGTGGDEPASATSTAAGSAAQFQWGRPIGQASVFASHEQFGPGFRSPRNGAGQWRSLSRWRAFSPVRLPSLPGGDGDRESPNRVTALGGNSGDVETREAPAYVGVSLERSQTHARTTDLSLGMQLRHSSEHFHWGHEWTRQWSDAAAGQPLADYRLLVSGAPWGYELRGALKYTIAPQRKWQSLTLAMPFSTRGNAEGAGPAFDQRWHLTVNAAPDRQSSVGLGWSQNGSQAFLSAQMLYSHSGGWSVGVGLNFSWSGSGHGTWLASPSHGRQGMADVRVAAPAGGLPHLRTGIDRALQDVIDEPAAGTRVVIDHMTRSDTTTLTDERGRVRISGLSERASHVLSLDVDSLPDPFLVPRYPLVRIRPRPGQTIPVPMELLPTVQLSGRLQLAATLDRPARELRGLVLQAVDAAGRVHAETRSFNDGSFQFDTLHAGGWRVRLRSGQRADGGPLEMDDRAVQIASGVTEIDDLNLEARRMRDQAGASNP